MTIEKSMSSRTCSCSAYDLPFLSAYQIEKPPARLLVDEPAPSLTISESWSSGSSKPRTVHVAKPRAAKAEAENPNHFPGVRLFSETILNLTEKPASSFSL